MQVRDFLKNNVVLITGITVPLILFISLILFFNFRKYSTPLPEYDFIYTFNNSQVSVKNNKIIYDYSKILPPAYRTTYPIIYVFHVKTNHTEAIVDFSNLNSAKMENNFNVIDIFTFPNATINQNATAPDGYCWKVNFGTEAPAILYGLEKNGKFVAAGRSDFNLKPHFLGWIIPNG